jgi:N12 class adenine-specific DNA methylase
LDKKLLKVVQLMPDYLPMNQVKVEISSFDSNNWMYVPKSFDDKENYIDEKPLLNEENKVLSRSYFGCWKVPIKMNDRIIENGLKVLDCNQETKWKRELKKKEKAYRDEIKEGLEQLKRQLDLKLEKIEQKLEQLLNRK